MPLVCAAGCSDEPTNPGKTTTSSSSSGSSSSTGANPEARLSGQLSYEFVGYDLETDGLDYGAVSTRPIRGARVLLLSAADESTLAETVSDDTGHYSFDWSGPSQVKLWVYAETKTPEIVIEDNTSNDAVYLMESAETTAEPGVGGKLDALATSGWTGNAYGKPRIAAPFSILDAMYTAGGRFLNETTPKPDFPRLHVNWSIDNRPEDGSEATGAIGTSHWDGDEIYVLGKESVDTDEFDTHVIVHEWGHSFEDNIARSDSPGGSHGFGDVLDPRIAFSEGFCTALSGIILDPDTVYSDSYGNLQEDGFFEDVEANDITSEAVPGWFSEESVQNIVFDVYDDKEEAFDPLTLGLQGVYDVMIGEMKTTDAMTSIFTFVSALKKKNPTSSAGLDTLVTYHKAGANYGFDPIADAWGTGETHTGGVTGSIPVYVDGGMGGSFNLALTGGIDSALLGQNKFIRFKGSGGFVTISTQCSSDVDLYVYQRGKEVASAYTTSGDELVNFQTTTGATYVINVQGYGESPGTYNALLEIQP